MKGLIFCAALACLSVTSAMAEGRKALIIGNADYDEISDLQNTLGDTKAYRDAFTDLGFEVTYLENLDLDGLANAVDAFTATLEPLDQAAFVYSGHGWSDGRVNYLIPTDAPAAGSERKLAGASYPLANGHDGLLDLIAEKKVTLSLAIIDACRNNPFAPPKAGTRAYGMSRGLVRIEAPVGSFVIFSAGQGQEALDRLPDDKAGASLSVFSRHFIPRLRKGIYLEDAISDAQLLTQQDALTFGGHEQLPAYEDLVPGKACLGGDCSAPVIAAAEPVAEPVAVPDGKKPTPIDQNPLVLACDVAAQHPSNSDNPNAVTPVEFSRIDTGFALQACEAAVAAFPDHLRSLYHLGRVKSAAKDEAAAFALYQKAAGENYPAAVNNLASAYEYGKGTTKNEVLARKYYDIACKDGLQTSCVASGEMMVYGRGGPADPELGRSMVEAVCNQSYAYGCERLAGIEKQRGASQDIVMGLYEKTCDLGGSEGCAQFGAGVQRLAKAEPDAQKKQALYSKAIPFVEQGCTAKLGYSCANLGAVYFDGLGAEKDDAKALAAYQTGCGLENALSCNRLGYMTETGMSVTADPVAGAALYEKACDLGNATGCSNAGLLYFYGKKFAQNTELGAALLNSACDKKLGDACRRLGFIYRDGDEQVSADAALSEAYFRKGCDLNDGRSCSRAGNAVANDAARTDKSEAAALYQKACDLKDVFGCSDLAWAYSEGKFGLKQDWIRAVKIAADACQMEGAGSVCRTYAQLLQENGDPADLDKFVAAMLRSCDLNYADSCAEIGLMYEGLENKLPQPRLSYLVKALEKKSKYPVWNVDHLDIGQGKLLQQALTQLGHYSGAIDGKLGPATKTALDRVYK